MNAPQPQLAITGAQGRLAQALLPPLAELYPTLAISRHWTHKVNLHTPSPSVNETNWQEFFTSPPAPSLRFVLHTAWSNTPITAEKHADHTNTPSPDLLLLERLCKHLLQNPNPARLIFFSSGSVYGKTSLSGATENTQTSPLGCYAKEKLAAEELLQHYAKQGLPCTILRISNPYGFPFHAQNPQGVIGHAIAHLQAQTCFTQWGENPVKDYLHINDFTRAIKLLLVKPLDGIWNLSSAQATPLSEILHHLQQLSSKTLQKMQKPAHSWDATPSVLNSHALQTALNWQAQIPLERGLKQVFHAK